MENENYHLLIGSLKTKIDENKNPNTFNNIPISTRTNNVNLDLQISRFHKN